MASGRLATFDTNQRRRRGADGIVFRLNFVASGWPLGRGKLRRALEGWGAYCQKCGFNAGDGSRRDLIFRRKLAVRGQPFAGSG